MMSTRIELGAKDFVTRIQGELQAGGAGASQETARLQRRALAKTLDCYRANFDDPHSGMMVAVGYGEQGDQRKVDEECYFATLTPYIGLIGRSRSVTQI